MKKTILWKIVLILLPALTFGLELMPDSVSVMLEEGPYQCSFFGTLPDGSHPLGLGVAAMLTVITAVTAVVACFSKKQPWYTALIWVSLAAATMSVFPLLTRANPPVLPTVIVALLLLVESFLAYLYMAQNRKEGSKKLSAPTL